MELHLMRKAPPAFEAEPIHVRPGEPAVLTYRGLDATREHLREVSWELLRQSAWGEVQAGGKADLAGADGTTFSAELHVEGEAIEVCRFKFHAHRHELRDDPELRPPARFLVLGGPDRSVRWQTQHGPDREDAALADLDASDDRRAAVAAGELTWIKLHEGGGVVMQPEERVRYRQLHAGTHSGTFEVETHRYDSAADPAPPETVGAAPITDPANTPGGWYLRQEAADERRFQTDRAQVAPALHAAASSILDQMATLMDVGYTGELAAHIVGVRARTDTDYLDYLRDRGVSEGHLMSPLGCARNALQAVFRQAHRVRGPMLDRNWNAEVADRRMFEQISVSDVRHAADRIRTEVPVPQERDAERLGEQVPKGEW